MQDNGNIVVCVYDNGKSQVDVRFQDETVWLTQAQLVELYQSSKANVSERIKNIFDDGELDRAATVRKFRTVRTEGDRQAGCELEYYNLDMIISLGYHIKSSIATKFRIWVTDRLREYITKGFAIVQNKLHYAAHGNTAGEVIYYRVDSNKPFAGMTNFRGKQPTRAEAMVAKNYLSQKELKALNNLVSAYFDIAEINTMEEKPMHMADHLRELDTILSSTGRKLLDNADKISTKQAKDKALAEYRKYRAKNLSGVEEDYLENIKKIVKKAKSEVVNKEQKNKEDI